MRGSKTRQKQLKMIEPHTLTNLRKLQCLDRGATNWEGGSFALLLEGSVFIDPPVRCLHLHTSRSTLLKGKAHMTLSSGGVIRQA